MNEKTIEAFKKKGIEMLQNGLAEKEYLAVILGPEIAMLMVSPSLPKFMFELAEWVEENR